MPSDMTVTHTIVCDNPACPGNTLDPGDRNGWLYVSSELYGEGPVVSHVYCSASCAGADAASFPAKYPSREESLAGMLHVDPEPAEAEA
jgi:hypothetical protein